MLVDIRTNFKQVVDVNLSAIQRVEDGAYRDALLMELIAEDFSG